MTHSWLRIIVASLLLTWAVVVRAESFVLIVVPSGDNIDYSGFENRLRSELAAEGYATITASLPSPIDAPVLSANATRFSSNIAISISIADGIVAGFVSVIDPGTARAIVRAVPGYPVGEQASSVFAVRATDVLHAVLLELDHVPNAPSSDPQTTPSPATPAKPSEAQGANQATPRPAITPASRSSNPAPGASTSHGTQWGMSVGVVINSGVHSMPAAPGAEAGLFLRRRHFGMNIEGMFNLPVATTFADSKISANQWLVGAGFQLFQPLSSGFALFESIGTGVYGVSISATSPNPANDRRPRDILGYASLGSGLISNLNDRTALSLQLRLVVPFGVANVIVEERTVAQLAFPIVLGDLGLRVAF